MPSDIESRIEARVAEFVAELSSLVREAALESVQYAFGGNGARTRGPGRPRGARSSNGPKRTPAELEALTAQLLAAIKKTPGSRIELIGKSMGVPTKELALPIRKLLADGAIRKRGQKRATAYSPR